MKSFFFTFVLLSILTLSSCQFRRSPVLDTDRNILRSGTNYYVLPVAHGEGGGLTLARGNGQTCPLEVVQEVSEGSNGLPVNFASANKDGIIRETVDLNIKFSDASTCAPNTVWRAEFSNGKRTLTSQGILGRPGKDTISNWFKIDKFEDHYKLVYCPSVCHTCKPDCAAVGSSIGEKGRRSLVLNNKPLKVMFKKA
ncbi:kunitz trypsin inhibitor 5-like [Rutidosis leptorrhynchoides]|uniref:kunitz trypsin inhibitor 5-like n=1 Tax=Rutidosis leptorrhynchoides TaxID=125765 RepID=UPI003A9A1FC4